jgi:uncharacterized protein (DUF1330 family)
MSKGIPGVLTRQVKLVGFTPIMFDRYAGDNKTQLMPEQKMYFARGGQTLIVPSENVKSFLCAINTDSAAKRFYDSREYKAIAAALLSFVMVSPEEITLTRDGGAIVFSGFGENGITLHRAVARLPKGIPNPKERPLVDLPWELSFELSIFENNVFKEVEVKNLFVKGGLAIGLGTYRGRYGKFTVDSWE